MMRTLGVLPMLALACALASAISLGCQAAEIIDPAAVQDDPDFRTQGEYLGEGPVFGDRPQKVGVQVVALGDAKFEAYVLAGGLPGEGWKRGEQRVRLEGRRNDGTTLLEGEGWQAKIAEGRLTLRRGEGKEARLKRVERTSPTLGAKPPQGAKVLFDGTSVEHFVGGVLSPLGTLMAGTTTKDKFNSYKLHLEFCLSYMPHARGQGRSNSGVYVHDCYEVQVLDSFGLEGRDNECGGIYSIRSVDLNMCLPPLVWQTFDVELTAPKYDAAGKKAANARITVRHNGVAIHDDYELPRNNGGRDTEGPGPRPIHFQAHGNKVQYRNIWLVEKP